MRSIHRSFRLSNHLFARYESPICPSQTTYTHDLHLDRLFRPLRILVTQVVTSGREKSICVVKRIIRHIARNQQTGAAFLICLKRGHLSLGLEIAYTHYVGHCMQNRTSEASSLMVRVCRHE
jgi:hypothetical protein